MTGIEDINLPPYDYELECMAISLCIMDIIYIKEFDSKCFYTDDLRKIYSFMKDNKTTDVSTIAYGTGFNADFIFEVSLKLLGTDTIDYVKTELWKYKNARSILSGIDKLERSARGLDIESSRKIIDSLGSLIDDMEKDVSIQDQAMMYLEDIYKDKKINPSGYTSIDSMCTIEGGQLVIVAGRPSMGKTTVMLNIAIRQSVDRNVGFLSMETKVNKIIDRIICMISGITSKQIDKKKEYYNKIIEYLDQIIDRKLFISDSIYSLSKIEQYIIKNKLDICFIDYLGLIQHPNPKGGIYENVTFITKYLKQIALKNNCTIILGVQLSREVEKRGDKQPQLSDLRDSGSIEQDADMVLMLYREDYYDKESEKKGILDMLVRKNRDGETGEIGLGLDLSKYKMIELQKSI